MWIRYEGGLHHTGPSLMERKKQHDQPRPKPTQIVTLRPRFCNFLAPVKHQRLCSPFSSRRIELIEGEAPLNMQAFLCFQITQVPNMIREFTPFLCSFDTLLIVLSHQSAKLRSCCRRTVSTRFMGASTLNHTCLATTQDVRRCWTVSSSWSQRGHLSGWGSPLLASLSDVQHLFLIANQRKFLHLARAQDFHSLRQGSKVTDPLK